MKHPKTIAHLTTAMTSIPRHGPEGYTGLSCAATGMLVWYINGKSQLLHTSEGTHERHEHYTSTKPSTWQTSSCLPL